MRAVVLASVAVGASVASAQIDTLTTIANGTITTNNDVALASFAYDKFHDRIWVAGFSGANQQIRKLDNISLNPAVNNGTISSTSTVFATAWTLYGRGGNTNATGGVPTPGSMLVNPQRIEALNVDPGNNVWITDAAVNVVITSVGHPEITKRVYRYNEGVNSVADGSDVFTTLVTLQNLQNAQTPVTTNTSDNSGRQAAWSGDGLSLYSISTGTAFAGLYKTNAAAGGVTKLVALPGRNTEPAVTTSGSVDTIYFQGGTSSFNAATNTTVDNTGGIDMVTHNGTTTGVVSVKVSTAAMNDFFEQTGTGTDVSSMVADSNGDIYFQNGNSARKGLYRLDAQGRLSKIVGFAERLAFFGGSTRNTNMLRQQMRTITASYLDANNAIVTFSVPQVLYEELGSTGTTNIIAGATAFKTGDFNRDNSVDQTDIAMFKAKLTVKGVVAATLDSRYDLNGNQEVSWKDVKVLQGFYGFRDGDSNIDQSVDSVDFATLVGGFGVTGRTWIGGDFTGEGTVDSTDFNILIANYGMDAPVVAGSLPSPAALGAVVPEPTTGFLLALSAGAMMRRRK